MSVTDKLQGMRIRKSYSPVSVAQKLDVLEHLSATLNQIQLFYLRNMRDLRPSTLLPCKVMTTQVSKLLP